MQHAHDGIRCLACARCCSAIGSGTGVPRQRHGAPLTATTLLAELVTTIGNGRDAMPAFGRAMRPEDLHDVAAYILGELVDD